MADKSTPVLPGPSRPSTGNGLFELLEYLDAANELINDKEDLRKLGLTEEEVEGYAEFFHDRYFPTVVDVI